MGHSAGHLNGRDTAPLVDFFQCRGLLCEVPGTGDLEEVAALVLDAAKNFGKKKRK
jgi:hypothetical protein